MYDTGLTPGHITHSMSNGDPVTTCNTPELTRCGYDWMTEFELEEHKMPGLSLAEYFKKGLLQKGCDNLKSKKKKYIETKRILFLSHCL